MTLPATTSSSLSVILLIWSIITLQSSVTNCFHFQPQDYYDNPAIVETHSHVSLDSGHPSANNPIHNSNDYNNDQGVNKTRTIKYSPSTGITGINLSPGVDLTTTINKGHQPTKLSPTNYFKQHPRVGPVRGVPSTKTKPLFDGHLIDHGHGHSTSGGDNEEEDAKEEEKKPSAVSLKNGNKQKASNLQADIKRINIKKKELLTKVHHQHADHQSSKDDQSEDKNGDNSGAGQEHKSGHSQQANQGRQANGHSKAHTSSKHDHNHQSSSPKEGGQQQETEPEQQPPQVNVQVLGSPEYVSEDYGNNYDTQEHPLHPHHDHHHHIPHNLRSYPYDYHEAYPYHGHQDVSYRSEFYWLIPLIMIIGIGALLLPLCSLFMTTLASNGAIGLTGRRRKRRSSSSSSSSDRGWTGPLLDLKYHGLDVMEIFDLNDDELNQSINRLLNVVGNSIASISSTD